MSIEDQLSSDEIVLSKADCEDRIFYATNRRIIQREKNILGLRESVSSVPYEEIDYISFRSKNYLDLMLFGTAIAILGILISDFFLNYIGLFMAIVGGVVSVPSLFYTRAWYQIVFKNSSKKEPKNWRIEILSLGRVKAFRRTAMKQISD